MYSRPPDHLRNRIKIPDNYNGNAFSGISDLSSRYSDVKEDNQLTVTEKEEISSHTPEARPPSSPPTIKNEEDDTKISISQASPSRNIAPQSNLLSSLLPTFIGSASHFPFGHGIGHEELLILAMMAMIFMSEGETDNELILLLGLLLFAG